MVNIIEFTSKYITDKYKKLDTVSDHLQQIEIDQFKLFGLFLKKSVIKYWHMPHLIFIQLYLWK